MINRVRALCVSVSLTLAAGVVGAVAIAPATDPEPSAQRVATTARAWTVTVRSILDARGLTAELRFGRLLSAAKHRVLNPSAFPPQVLVGGKPAQLDQEVPADATVHVVPGRDSTEPVVRRLVTQQADTQAGLYLPGTTGLVVVRVGKVSGELVSRRVVREPRRGALRTPGSILLTFDDGPDPVWTPQVLALLRSHHVHAIFCLIGRQARRYPALVRQIVADGNLLCDHTEDHDEHLATDRFSVATAQITAGAQAIEAATGTAPLYFRAPGGDWSPTVERMARHLGMVPLKWNVDPRDWEHPNARVIVARVVNAARPGSVLLLHDGGGDRGPTLAALRGLFKQFPRLRMHVAEPDPNPVAP